jgi:hypothetical protein
VSNLTICSIRPHSFDVDILRRLLPTATSLLLSLANPLNITLITSQLLSAPTLWDEIRDLRACRRIFSVFYTAALQQSQQSLTRPRFGYKPIESLQKEEWTKAVVKGADDQSPRWRHALVLGAILLGFEEKQKQSLPSQLRSKLESALVTATNLALQVSGADDPIDKYALAFVLNHTFELLTDYNRAQLNYDIVLPVFLEAVFSSKEGLEHGYWLSIIDRDVVEGADRKFTWSARSNTYQIIREIQERPLIASLGPLSRLIAHSVENVSESSLLLPTLDRLAGFARTLSISWRQNKLSEIDVSEELDFLDAEATKSTLPTLWHVLRLSLFATVIILRAVVGNLLGDAILASDLRAPFLAIQCLHILRNLYFVASRLGQTSSSQYVFVSMVAIDVLTLYPEQAEKFIQSISPIEQGQIPNHPVERCFDLFFFNTAEHFTLTLPPILNEGLILAGAMPYLAAGGSKFLMEIFEAAHSVTLAVLAGPQNAEVAARHLPFYLDALFKCFPDSLSARQFRLAFKTIVRISSPPSALAQSQPLLPSMLLETLFDRAKHAPTNTMPQLTLKPQLGAPETPLSEQAVLVMALIDSLCFLHPALLEEWLPLVASGVAQIEDPEMRKGCQDRFWETMSSGEMDVERAALCVAWWNSRGGREQVLQNNEAQQGEYVMSGALPMDSKL